MTTEVIEPKPIPVRIERVGREERSLLRQLAKRKALRLGMTKAEWERKRREAVSMVAADTLMIYWPPSATDATGKPIPHPFT